MNNLHISLTEFRNESRVLKEVGSISSQPGMEHVYIAALHGDCLETNEIISNKISLKRFVLKTRKYNKGLVSQLVKYIEFVFRVAFFYRNKTIDTVNVHALGLLPLGYLLKVIYDAKLIYDTHELETETNGLKGIRKRLAKMVERILIRRADHVFVVGENIANWYQKEYEIPRPTVVMNAPRFKSIEKNQYFRNHFDLRDDQIIVLYQGGLDPCRGVDLLLEAFSQRADDKVVIVLMGYGILEKQIQDMAMKHNTIFFHNAVSSEDLLSYTASADIGIHTIKNTCLNHYYCMPNKLFEYIMAGLPVLVSNMKDMREFVRKYEVGLVIESETVESISQTLDELVTIDMAQYKKNTRQASLENSWEHQERKILADYNSLWGKT